MSIRKPQYLTHSRAAVTGDDLKDCFDEQVKIFNCDETYVSLCPLFEKVLLAKGSRSAYKVVDSDKEGFTVLFMYSANGDRAPPMIMFPYK
ncbi:GSCOCG00012625001-RA-CDS, partial [Cotesia congregata]